MNTPSYSERIRQILPIIIRATIPIALAVLSVWFLTFVIALPEIKDDLIASKMSTSKDLTSAVRELLHAYNIRVINGELSLEEAQARAANNIRQMRYGPDRSDYFWINDTSPLMIMHPYRLDLIGTDLSDYQDIDGKYVFREMVSLVEKEREGYVDYKWQWISDAKRISPKSSYIMLFEPWDWIIGTGIYLDVVNNDIYLMTRKTYLIFYIILSMILFLSTIITIRNVKSELARNQAVKQLHANERKYRSIYENLQDVYFELAPDGTILELSPSVESVSQYSQDELPSMSIWDLYADKNQKSNLQAIQDNNGKITDHEITLLDKDGSKLYCSVTAQIMTSGNPSEDFICGTLRDITPRKNAEIILRKEHDLIKAVLDTTSALVMLLDCDGRIRRFNRACEMVSGYTATEISGKMAHDLFLDEADKRYFNEYLSDISVIHNTGKYTNRWITRNGEIRLIEWVNTLLYAADNSPEYIIATGTDITERQQVLDALSNSEEQLRLALEASNEGIWDYNIPANAIYLSQGWYAMLGMQTQEDSHGIEAWFSRTHPADIDAVRTGIQLCIDNVENNFETEHRLQAHDGRWLWVLSRGKTVEYGNTGKPVRIVGTISDITAIKEMRDEQRKLIALIEKSTELIGIMDSDGSFLYLNESGRTMIGIHPDSDIENVDYKNIFSDCNTDAVKESITQAINAGIPWSGEGRIKKQNENKILDVHIITFRIDHYRNGSGYATAAVVSDISERKTAESALSQSEEKYRNIFTQSVDGILLTDEKGVIIEINPAAEQILGIRRTEGVGKHISELHCDFLVPGRNRPEITDKIHASIDELFKTGYIADNKRFQMSSFKRADGQIRELQVSLSSIETDSGYRICSIFRDITDLRAAEKEKALLEEQYRQAQKLQSIGQLAGGIAHDFNNILTVISGFTEIAARTLDSKFPTVTEYLTEVINASERARGIIQQILSFSRKSKEEKIALKASIIVKETIKFLRASLPTTIEIRQHVDCENDTVFADPSQINQILMNLCTNAAYAMGENGGTLTINLKSVNIDASEARMYSSLMPGKHLQLRISDTGPGMAKEIMEHIFEPYFTTKPKGEGTGLGLAVVYGIVKSLNGFIGVRSKTGSGTTFEILVPLMDVSATEQKAELPTTICPKANILFVDDEKQVASIMLVMLSEMGHTTEIYNESRKAFDSFKKSPDYYDLVITDQTMPGMTGYELSKHLLAFRPDIPIIICTGYSDHLNLHKAKAAGIRELLYKPVSSAKLAATIAKVLTSQPTTQ